MGKIQVMTFLIQELYVRFKGTPGNQALDKSFRSCLLNILALCRYARSLSGFRDGQYKNEIVPFLARAFFTSSKRRISFGSNGYHVRTAKSIKENEELIAISSKYTTYRDGAKFEPNRIETDPVRVETFINKKC